MIGDARRGGSIHQRMKIHPASIGEQDGRIEVCYRFETPSRPDLAGELRFTIEARHRAYLHTGPEPAAAALAMVAMALGEDIELSEPVSPRFHHGFGQFNAHFHLWLPRELKMIRLRVPAFSRMERPGAREIVSCFSGGVDSFTTLFQHLGDAANEDFRITQLFYAHGFDIPLANTLYDELAAEFAGLAKGWGLGFIGIGTNAREILDPLVPWVNTHGACLAACALLLSGGARKFIIPSTNRHSLLFVPCGSNPVTDPMLGSESLEILHDGSHLSRIQKIMTIADRPEVQQHLRVCWKNVPGQRNCGRCIKCLKTMMPLAVTGVLEKFGVFPPLPPWNEIPAKCFDPLDLTRYAPELSYAGELRELAASRGAQLPGS